MTPEDRAILAEFAERARELEPRARIWGFGSRARGDARADSDLDVCVVLPSVKPELQDALRDRAWETAFKHGRVMPVIVLSEEAFERGPVSVSSLVAAVLRDGVAA